MKDLLAKHGLSLGSSCQEINKTRDRWGHLAMYLGHNLSLAVCCVPLLHFVEKHVIMEMIAM